jgi:electron transfer flavoprotein beta subunit
VTGGDIGASRVPDAAPALDRTAPTVVVCMKLVELRAGVDALTGVVIPDPASAGPSPADEAALEWGLRIAEASGGKVVAISAGGPECEPMLRSALAAGAHEATRVPVGADDPSATVASVLAEVIRGTLAQGASGMVVCCGDASLDRGSGSVPAFLAGELRAAQALGLCSLGMPTGTGPIVLEADRRLEGGRRERLRLRPPCVMSFEAVTARLRRASLTAVLASRDLRIGVVSGRRTGDGRPPAPPHVSPVGEGPFRPRTRVVPAPPGTAPLQRIRALLGSPGVHRAARTLQLEPDQAAAVLLDALAEWGELPPEVLAHGEAGQTKISADEERTTS